MPEKRGLTQGCLQAAALDGSSFTRPIPTSCLHAYWGAQPDRNKSVVFSARQTAVSTGSGFYLPEKMYAGPAYTGIRTIHTRCLRVCGKWKCTPGGNSAAALAAGFMSHTI